MPRHFKEAQYLLELTGSDGAVYGFSTGRGFAPTDADESLVGAFYSPRVSGSAALTISRQTDGAGSVQGAGGLVFGAITLENADGGLDGLADIGFDGRPLRVLYAPAGSTTVAAASVMYRGTVTELQVGRLEVRVEARDRLEELNTPVGAQIDAGEWPGAEGGRMPVCAGAPVSIPFVWLDRVKLIGALHDGAATVNGVYDLGVALTVGSAYSSIADMKANAPSGGYYRVFSDASGTYVRLGSLPADLDKIAADVTTADPTGPAQIQALASRAPTVSAGTDIDAAAFTALSRDWSFGGYWAGEATVLEACAEIAASLGCVIFFDRTGKLSAARLTPEPDPAIALNVNGPQSPAPGGTSRRALDLDRSRLGKPVKQISVGFNRSYAHYSDLGALWSTAPTRAARVSRDYDRATVSDAPTAAKHLLAGEERIDTLLDDQTNAETVAEELRAARGAFLHTFRLSADEEVIGALELGAVTALHESRFSASAIEAAIRQIDHDITNGIITVGARE